MGYLLEALALGVSQQSGSFGPEATNLGPKLWDVSWAVMGSVGSRIWWEGRVDQGCGCQRSLVSSGAPGEPPAPL